MNSGNFFSSIKFKCNLDRKSRVDLLIEYLGLDEKLKNMCDIGFNCLYPSINEILELRNNYEYIKNKYGNELIEGKTVYYINNEINLMLENTKPFLTLSEIQKNKYIFCPEGFDVSSSLNWVLCSKSLAIVPPQHYENTIINSDVLKPYQHYVPINEDYSNLSEIIEWVMNNDE